MARFVCDRCQTTWDDDEARCPQCLRKTSVRSTERPSSEAARLASGNHAQTDGARRAMALLAAVAANIASGVAVSLAWRTITLLSLRGPVLFAWSVAGASWLGTAVLGGPSWMVLVRRAAIACALGAWAFVSATLAVASASDLSPPFTVGLAAILFGAGVIGVLSRMRSDQEPRKPASGKWR